MFFQLYLLFFVLPFILNQRQLGRFSNRKLDSDQIIFEEQDDKGKGFVWNDYLRLTTARSTSTVAVPGMETTKSPCEQRCRITNQYNPVCGTNSMTYDNPAWLRCAQRCGRGVNLSHYGVCASSLVLLRT
ncbi:hypothetical protein FQA39_LY00642 [Lamprigera yunnana]|nr:hypothetical protein FQA39_LY00642 [Lamprigera yunnana]